MGVFNYYSKDIVNGKIKKVCIAGERNVGGRTIHTLFNGYMVMKGRKGEIHISTGES
jgi:hypothetical protein